MRACARVTTQTCSGGVCLCDWQLDAEHYYEASSDVTLSVGAELLTAVMPKLVLFHVTPCRPVNTHRRFEEP